MRLSLRCAVTDMNAPCLKPNQAQRIQIDIEPFRSADFKIRVEKFDEKLGWYTAASIRIPLHEIAALQERLGEIQSACSDQARSQKIVPYAAILEHLQKVSTNPNS